MDIWNRLFNPNLKSSVLNTPQTLKVILANKKLKLGWFINMAKPIRIGIVGSRFAAQFHYTTYQRVTGIDVENWH